MSRRFALTLLLAPALAGCFYPADRGKALEMRVSKLESEKRGLEDALNKQKELLAAQVPKLDRQVDQVEKALEKLDKASRRTDADTSVELEQVKGDVSQLRGSIEQYLHKIAELEQKLAAAKESSDRAVETAAETVKAREAAARKKAEQAEHPADKRAFLDLVTARLTDDPATGRELAFDWLKKFPKDSLAARVHYELGNSYLAEKDHRAALSEFGEIVNGFGKSDHAPNALLKSSECFAALKMTEESRLALEEILERYPRSDAARAAKTRLAVAKKPPKGKK